MAAERIIQTRGPRFGDLCSNRNEYQSYLLGSKGGG